MRGAGSAPGAGAGIALFSLGVFLFAVNDALGKWLVGSYAVPEILALRAVGAAAVLLPFALWRRPNLDVRDQWRLHLLRVTCSVVDSFGFYFASRTLPLADVMCFYLAGPLIVTALAALLLREPVGRFRWSAVLVGFGGVVLALRPSGGAVSLGTVAALGGAIAFAATMVATRGLRRTDWLTLVAWQFVGSGLVGLLLLPGVWVAPGAADAALMALVGAVSMGCFAFITLALAMAPASLLAPFQYASIVWAALMGYLVWGDVPGPSVVWGSAIIVASGLAVFARERRRARAPAAEAVAPVP